MIYNYKNSKILILFYQNCIIIDGTTQDDIQKRLYSLRNYYRNDITMKNFLDNCQVQLIEVFPCHNKFELSQRIKMYYSKLLLDESLPFHFIKYKHLDKCNSREGR